MIDSFVFHIRNAHPRDLAAVLATLEASPELPTVSEIVNRAEALGFVIRDRQRLESLMTARDLGLVRKDQNILTDRGRSLVQLEAIKPSLFADIVHGLLYTLWEPMSKEKNCFSWSYRTICQMLWQGGTKSIENKRELASEVETLARSTFAVSRVSFSPKSVGGAFLWLSELVPPVLNEGKTRFSRRLFCPPELFVMAVDFVYRSSETDYSATLLLNEENIETVSQVCLLEPSHFDRVLEYATTQFSYLHKGIGGGWGQYIILDHPPNIGDFI